MKNNKITKLNEVETSKGETTPLVFSFKGNDYRLVDFNNEYDFEQEQISKPLIARMFREIFLNNKDNDTEQNIMISIAANSLELDFDTELAALIWLEKNEDEFNKETYIERIEKFKKLRGEALHIAKLGIKDFFSLKVPSLINDSQTILGSLNKVGQ